MICQVHREWVIQKTIPSLASCQQKQSFVNLQSVLDFISPRRSVTLLAWTHNIFITHDKGTVADSTNNVAAAKKNDHMERAARSLLQATRDPPNPPEIETL